MEVAIEVRKLLVLLVVKHAAGAPNYPNGVARRGTRRQRLQSLGALLADLVNGMFNLTLCFKLEWVEEYTPIFKEDQKAPDDFGFGWAGIGPLDAAYRRADSCYASCGFGRYLSAASKEIAHMCSYV